MGESMNPAYSLSVSCDCGATLVSESWSRVELNELGEAWAALHEDHHASPGQLETWIPSPPPGGWVCAELDEEQADGRICGMPTESEPCPIHHPDTKEGTPT